MNDEHGSICTNHSVGGVRWPRRYNLRPDDTRLHEETMNIAPPYDAIYAASMFVLLLVAIAGLAAFESWRGR